MDTASVQVNSYLKQWSDFTDGSTSDLHATMNLKLEALCATADKVCEALAAVSTKYDVEGKGAKTIALSIEAEIATLQMEISSATDAQRDEEAAMKAVLTTKRRTAIETARKSIVHVKKDRGVQSNRQNTKQLMLALRDL